jgi:hypothetical protein
MPNVIGNGSTADAARLEQSVGGGFKLFGRDHIGKAQQYIRALRNWLRATPEASPADKEAAQEMIEDMENAVSGK